MVADAFASIARMLLPKPCYNSNGTLLKPSEKGQLPRPFGESSNVSSSIHLDLANLITGYRPCIFRFAHALCIHWASILLLARINRWRLSRLSDYSRTRVHDLCNARRIGQPRLLKSFPPQPTAIAAATRPALRIGIVAAERQRVIHAKTRPFPDDFGFRSLQERRVHVEGAAAFHGSLGGQVGEPLKLGEKLWATIRIAAVIDGIGADEQIKRFDDFRIAERQAKRSEEHT